ncbi:hypothetical protein Galf_1169 [Gallionella capsiferriformans ES-2]|jgi:hypothetical protein|uniref:Uncharacterized protein n=1 Tax=Gallionella capsiferriformans (strain ES-2) TaxID=395494 RepID=D9SFA0_GALCS|nr:hypothetical protein Galf_1169 [Gallionella capsiferriformans ES-2]
MSLEINFLSTLPGAFYTRVIKNAEYVYFGCWDVNVRREAIQHFIVRRTAAWPYS